MKALETLKLTQRRMEIIKELGLNETEDVLRYYPVKYEEYNLMKYDDFKVGERVVFKGEILTTPSTYRYNSRQSITRFRVLVDDEELYLSIFNRPWAKTLKINDVIIVVGKYDGNNRVTVLNYFDEKREDMLGIVPIYALKEGISQNDIKKIVDYVLNKVNEELVDDIPLYLKEKYQLLSFKEAIYEIHHPSSKDMLRKAITRFKYEEFLKFYLAINILNNNHLNKYKEAKIFDMHKIDALIASLEFELTDDQRDAIKDILNDLKQKRLMYRLLQGDVGSGKTVVALIALYANYLSAYQGALMAPTEILAKQHYEYFKIMLEPLGVKVALLTGSSKDKKDIKEALENHEIDIIIGTHALFSDDIEMPNLGLVITDEQQRFGVKQRRKLKSKGDSADFLLMSATPIPRTLASAIYGDMDISSIKTMPKNRKGCDTYIVGKNSIVSIMDDIKTILKQGRQVYMITAAIDANENYGAKDAITLYNSLIDVFKPYKLGLLHGKMSSDEKRNVMEAFEDNRIQILISTTVVEVGVNVKNATCMIVYDAERFGMSQLHQLRGRVQRSSYRGSFYLLSDTKELEAKKRFEILESTNDGFKIAEEDLKLRGPGDILGTRQSGIANFILGDIINDTKIITAAKEDAKIILDNLNDEANQMIYRLVYEIANKNYID